MSEAINDERGGCKRLKAQNHVGEVNEMVMSVKQAKARNEHLFKCPECERLKKQNAELLEALKLATSADFDCTDEFITGTTSEIREVLRSAIRRAEEGK
jgi:hypothetical protein